MLLLKRCLSNAHFLNNYDFSSIANAILGYKGASEYYFLVWMLSFYFLYPIFSLITAKKNTLFYIVILMFLLNSTLVPFARLVGFGNLSQFKFPLPENFIFVLLGYLLFTTDIKKKYRLWIYAGALWGGIYKFLWIYYLSGLGGRLDKGLTGYFVFPSVLLASGVFVYFKYSHFYKYFSSKLLKLLSSCSLGIYLIHIVLLPYERQILNVKESNFYWRIFCPFLTYIVCLICVLIIKKIPLLRWVVGDAPRTDNLKST